MADRSRSKAHTSGNPAKAAAAAAARHPVQRQGAGFSVVRTAVAAAVSLLGIAYIAVYLTVGKDGKQLTWMADLGLWNFLIGLAWIVVYYMAGQPTTIPVLSDLQAYNLLVGIGFMAVGFVYATRWE